MPLFPYFCYWCSRDIKANTLLSFEKDLSLHFRINIFTQLLFKFFPSITNVWHFRWAPQDHGHKARISIKEHWSTDRALKRGPALLPGLPRLPLLSLSADCSKWLITSKWEEQSPVTLTLWEITLTGFLKEILVRFETKVGGIKAWIDEMALVGWYDMCLCVWFFLQWWNSSRDLCFQYSLVAQWSNTGGIPILLSKFTQRKPHRKRYFKWLWLLSYHLVTSGFGAYLKLCSYLTLEIFPVSNNGNTYELLSIIILNFCLNKLDIMLKTLHGYYQI